MLLVDEGQHHLDHHSDDLVEDVLLLVLGNGELGKVRSQLWEILLADEIGTFLSDNAICKEAHDLKSDGVREDHHSNCSNNGGEGEIVVKWDVHCVKDLSPFSNWLICKHQSKIL